MTTTRQDLLQALTQIQNHPAFAGTDILSIHGCAPVSTDDELRTAIDNNLEYIARWNEQHPLKLPRRRAA